MPTATPPIWLMRQAGRYLPEYRALRANAADFLAFCYDPEMATEATLQPIRRFGFDAAIIFSDILVVPDALGQEVRFVQGEGPKLAAITRPEEIDALDPDGIGAKLGPVYQALRNVAAALPAKTALIGFAGAPWTLAAYMIEGGGSKTFTKVKRFAFLYPDAFQALIDMLVDIVADTISVLVGSASLRVRAC